MWKQLAKVARNVGDLITGNVHLYPKPLVLHEFKTKADLSKWQVFTDSSFGGTTTASFDLSDDHKAGVFSGQYSSTPGNSEAQLARSGYCGISTKVVRIGDVYDLDSFEALQYTIKADGHTYIANVRVENFTGQATDVWQVPFRTTASDEWQELTIPFTSFVPTKAGRLIKTRLQLARGKIISLGLALAPWDLLHQADSNTPADSKSNVASSTSDRRTGPFRLEVASIVATGMAPIDIHAS